MNAAAIAAVNAVEIKVTIRADQELRAERAMEVDEDEILDDAQRETELMLERLNLRHLLDMPVTFWDVRAADHLRH